MNVAEASSTSLNTPKQKDSASAPFTWRIGDIILDTYEVRQVFTTGGLSYVYRVHHLDWGMDLAVKTPRPQGEELSKTSVDLFVREAETWVNLGLYPHIVSCYFIRVLGGIPRIFMEFVDGGTLLEAIQLGALYAGDRKQVLERMLDIAIQVLWGLHFAHQKGLVHQDVKPANVLLASDGLVKVTDFGMAQARSTLAHQKQIDETDFAKMDFAYSGGNTMIVNTTGLTPAYCSPEQAANGPLTRRTDIWSWAVSILEMFMGGKTWKNGANAPESLADYLKSGANHPRIPSMPGPLAGLLRQCFLSDPEARPRDMSVLVKLLQDIYKHEIGQPYPRAEPHMKTVLADTLNNRAVSMIDLGREQEAVRLLDEALQAETTHAAALYNRGLIDWRSARLTDMDVLEALAENEQGLRESWESAYYTSLIQMEQGDTAGAGAILDAAVQQHGALSPLVRAARAAQNSSAPAGGCLRVMDSSESSINSVAVSSKGDSILSGGNDRLVRVWDAATGECIRTMPGHQELIRTVAISPDGRLGLSGGWDRLLRLWELSSGRCLQILQGHTDLVQDVSFTPDGRRAVSASSDGTLRVWDLQSGESQVRLAGHLDTVFAAAVFPNGRYAVSASFDNTLRIWDLQNGNCLSTIQWIKACTSNLALSYDGRKLLLAGGDHQLWLIDMLTRKPERSFSGHCGTIKSVRIAPNSAWALSGGADGTLRLWHLESGRCLRTFTGHTSSVNSISISSGKALAVSGSSDRTLRLWLLGVGEAAPYITVIPRSSKEIVEHAVQIDKQLKDARKKYMDGDYAGALALIARLRTIPGYQQNPQLLEAWEQVGRKGRRDGFRSSWSIRNFQPHPAGVSAVALSRGAEFALTGGNDPVVRLWRTDSGECQREFHGHKDRVRSVALSPNGELALSASGDGTLRLWKADSEKCLKVLTGHTSEVSSVAMLSDSTFALSGSNDNTLRIWDLGRGKSLRVLKGHTHYVRAVVLAPNGRLGISAGWDKTVRLWDLASGECLETLYGHEEVIDALAVSPDGACVLSGGQDHTLRLWDLESGTCTRQIENIQGNIRAIAFSPDGRFVFSGDQHGVISLWDVAAGQLISKFNAHGNAVTALAASQDGRVLASASLDFTFTLWRLDWEFSFSDRPVWDRTLQGYLSNFLNSRLLLTPGKVKRQGRLAWNQADLNELLEDLSYRGYGNIPAQEIVSTLKQMAKKHNG